MAQQEKTISLGKDQEVPEPAQYRGAMVQNRGAMESQVNMGAQRAGKSAASMQSAQFGGKADNVMQLETDAAPNAKGAQKIEIQVVGGDVEAPAAAQMKLQVNEVTHTTVADASPQAVLSQLTTTIGAFSDATHTVVDAEGLSLSGCAFVGDYHAVHFKIDVTADDEGTRFEFLRTSGSALAAAKFLGIVNQAFAKAAPREKRSSSGNLLVDAVVNAVHDAMEEAAEQGSLVALDTSGLDDLKMDDAAVEKMQVMDALHADDAMPVEMDGLSEQYLTQKLIEGGAIAEDATVDHKRLIEVLLEENTLAHKDVAVVRASSLILAQLVKSNAAQIVTGDTFEALGAALGAPEKSPLARKYVVSLLSAMAQADGAWKVAAKDKAALVVAVEAVQAELEQAKGVEFERREFETVDCKAVLAKLNA